MTNVAVLSKTEGERWRTCVIHSAKAQLFQAVALRLITPKYKSVYQEIESETKVPWFVVAVIHEREASQNFSRSIAQGDAWCARSVHVPKGRGPFKSFKEAAYDALVNCAPKAGRWTDWSIGGVLTILEEYNGLGYANKNVPSPYIWAGTNQYAAGKYVADGRFDATVVDTQLGCAGLLMAMAQLDHGIIFGDAPVGAAAAPVARLSPTKPAVPVVPQAHDAPPLVPGLSNPAAGSVGIAVAHLFGHLFG